MYFTTIENFSCVYFLQNLLSWIRIRMDPHSFYLLDPDSDPHSEKLLDQDPQKMNADPQPCFPCSLTGSLFVQALRLGTLMGKGGLYVMPFATLYCAARALIGRQVDLF